MLMLMLMLMMLMLVMMFILLWSGRNVFRACGGAICIFAIFGYFGGVLCVIRGWTGEGLFFRGVSLMIILFVGLLFSIGCFIRFFQCIWVLDSNLNKVKQVLPDWFLHILFGLPWWQLEDKPMLEYNLHFQNRQAQWTKKVWQQLMSTHQNYQ